MSVSFLKIDYSSIHNGLVNPSYLLYLKRLWVFFQMAPHPPMLPTALRRGNLKRIKSCIHIMNFHESLPEVYNRPLTIHLGTKVSNEETK